MDQIQTFISCLNPSAVSAWCKFPGATSQMNQMQGFNIPSLLFLSKHSAEFVLDYLVSLLVLWLCYLIG
jgi:hypothetical protein